MKVEESEASQGTSTLEHFAKSIRVKRIKEECDENEEEEDVEEKKKDMMFERVNIKKKEKEAVGKVEVTEEAEMIVDENGSEEDSVEEEGPSVTQEKVKTEEDQEQEEDERPETPLALSGIPRRDANEDDDEAMNSSFLDDSETPNWSAELLSDQPLSASGPSTGEWVGLGVTLPSQEIILTQQDIEDQEMKMASLKEDIEDNDDDEVDAAPFTQEEKSYLLTKKRKKQKRRKEKELEQSQAAAAQNEAPKAKVIISATQGGKELIGTGHRVGMSASQYTPNTPQPQKDGWNVFSPFDGIGSASFALWNIG